jgi:Anti-sigma-D factor RsdA to sigma factor binding region
VTGRRPLRRRTDPSGSGTGGDLGTASGVGGGELSADELAAMRADDALLDALGRGEPVARDDELAEMLGAWRAEMDTEPLPAIDLAAAAPAVDLHARPFRDAHPLAAAAASEATGVSGLAEAARVRPAVGRAAPRPRGAADGAVGPGDGSGLAGAAGTGPGRVRSRRWPRGVRLGLVLALVIAAAGGVSVAADRGGPDGPLWTVVRLVDPDRADLREAQDAVAKARKAVEERRYADARTLIDRADGLVAKVRDPIAQAKLRAELDALRHSLPAGVSGVEPGGGASTGPGGGPVPGPTTTPAPGQPGGGGKGGSTGTPTPGQTGGGGLLPPLLPSSPAPLLPTCLLPSILPTGPILGLPGLPPVCK